MYKIEKGIEIWGGSDARGRRTKYPFGELEVSDSFFIPQEDIAHSSNPSTIICTAASIYGLRHGKKFTTRICYDPKGYRVWRVE